MYLCSALLSRRPIITSGIKRVEVFIRLSLSSERQQASGPLRHAQIISAPRHMHSNQFVIYFIIIPWLQFEADGFIIHDRQPFESWAFSFALLSFTFFFPEHNPDLLSFLMLPHSDASRRGEGSMPESACVLFYIIRLVWCRSSLSTALAKPLISPLVSTMMDRCPLSGFEAWGVPKERGDNPSRQDLVSFFLDLIHLFNSKMPRVCSEI